MRCIVLNDAKTKTKKKSKQNNAFQINFDKWK